MLRRLRSPTLELLAATLERQVLGARRVGDVPGFEIPARYFQFVRSGDRGRSRRARAQPPRPAVAGGADRAAAAPDAHRPGRRPRRARGARARPRLRARRPRRARRAPRFATRIGRCRSPRGAYDIVRIEALRALRARMRGARAGSTKRRPAGASCSRSPGCPPHVAREATEALAIHHEHRAARSGGGESVCVEESGDRTRPGLASAVRHRLARIERKIDSAAVEARSLNFDVASG